MLTEDQILKMMTMAGKPTWDVALEIDVPVESVSRARGELKKYGWTCGVRYGACRHCRQPLAIRSRQLIHGYHPSCWVSANQDVIKRREAKQQRVAQRAMEAASGESRRRTVPRRSNSLWTAEDDAILRSMLDALVALACVTLQRSSGSVVNRRKIIRDAMLDDQLH